MLGIGWMESNNVTWEFGRGRIKIGKQFYGLKCSSDSGTWCRRVFLQQYVVVPPRTEMDLPTAVVMRTLPRDAEVEDMAWGTVVAPGVHVSRTLVLGDRLVYISARVMNVRSEQVSLKSGTNISDPLPVTVSSKVPVSECQKSWNIKVTEAKSTAEIPSFLQNLVDKVNDSLLESVCANLIDILAKYADVFSEGENDIGVTSLVTHHIDTADAKPIKQQFRRHPPLHREAISRQVDDYLSQELLNLLLVRGNPTWYS